MPATITCTDVGVRTGWLLAAALLLSACNPLNDFGGLEEQLQTYYHAEQTGDWGQVYDLRVRDFRWSVSRDYFIKAMQEDAQGWELLDYHIVAAEGDADKVRISLHLRYRNTSDKGGIKAIDDTVIWLYEDDRWLCKDAGVHQHLPMNDPLD